MAAPTQAFPPWLSPSPVTVTQDGTVVVQTTVIQFPQTYYGPSIPLGPDWVFGGSTFPASIATSFASPTSTSLASQTAIPSSTPTSSASSNSSPSQTFTISSSINPSTSSGSASSSFPPSSSPSPTNSSHGISSATRLAIILTTVIGALMLAALAIVVCRVRRRRHRHGALTQEGSFSNWQLVNPSAAHQPLEGAAEEAEGSAFLSNERGMRERSVGPILSRERSNPSSRQTQADEPAALSHDASDGSGSESGGAKSDTSTLDSAAQREDLTRFNASASTVAAGSLFFNPARGNDQGSGVRRSDEEPIQEAETSLTAATLASSQRSYAARPPGAGPPQVPSRSSNRPPIDPQYNLPISLEDDDAEEQFRPPRLLDPDRVLQLQNRQLSGGSRSSWIYPDSPPSENDERATLLTAQRINVGSVAHPVIASPPSEKSRSFEDLKVALDVEPDDHVFGTPPSPRSWIGMGGLTGFAKGLGRFSWFRRMEAIAGPSGTRHSNPSSSHRGSGSKPVSRPVSGAGSRPGSRPVSGPGSRPGSGPGSRPTSGVSFTSGNRRYSGLLHPPFAPRPRSDVSFHGIEAELGIRPPGIRISGTGSASGGSGSGKSGGTVYHSVSSRPPTPIYATDIHTHHEGELLHTQPTPITLLPELDLAEGDNTIRSVDVLDLPVPERGLPLTGPLRPEPALRPDTASSRGTRLTFPPGLVAVPQWDRGSSSSLNPREERDLLEDDPPQAGGEWSSLRSKKSSSDVGDDGNRVPEGRRGPVTRHSTGEQAVQVISGDHAASETASFSSGLQQVDRSGSPSVAGPSLVLTPSVSVYGSSHSGSASHSSRPSQHTASHSHELSHHSSNLESDDGHLGRGLGSHRASLSAMGGEGGPPSPPLPQFRALSLMQPTIEVEDETGGTISRPNTGTSRPTMSEATYTGTLASGSTSTGAPTTVPSMTSSSGKR